MSIDALAQNSTLWSIMLRFFINLGVLFILIRVIYYKYSKKDEYLFSFFMMGIMVFLICSILETLKLQMGMALGLFAIFAILRFRTINFSAKEMTYIFTIIGISVINSQAHIPPPIVGALLINSIVILTTYLLEIYLHKKSLNTFLIVYNKLKLLNPDFNQDLLDDLSRHTGQNIVKVKIRKMNIGKGNAELEIYFKDKNIS
jgi:hypothetical protein